MHHAYSDTPKRPALAANFTRTSFTMMWATKHALRRLRLRPRSSPRRASTAGYPEWPALDRSASLGRCASSWVGALHARSTSRSRPHWWLFAAPAGALHDGPDPRRDRELVRPQVRLPELRQRATTRATRSSFDFVTHGRAVPEQPPQVRHDPELRGALVRDRPDLPDHQAVHSRLWASSISARHRSEPAFPARNRRRRVDASLRIAARCRPPRILIRAVRGSSGRTMDFGVNQGIGGGALPPLP